MSVPLANDRSPAPRSTTARTPGSRSRRSQASWSASYISNVIALRASGRLKVTTATAPSCSRRRWSVIPAAPGGARLPWREAYPLAPAPLIQEVLEEAPPQLGLKPVMPAFMLPYYNGVVPEDCGVSAFVFLAGGHFTLHTFSFREAYFADLVAPTAFDAGRLRDVLEAVFPCAITTVQTVDRQDLKDTEPDMDADFGPHLFLNIDAYQGPQSMDTLFALFDRLPRSIGMTPIMRPYVIRDRWADGRGVLAAMTMIAESHVSLHVFPDEERAYFGIFSCRFFDRDRVVPQLKACFPGGTVQGALTPRGSRYRFLPTEREREHARPRAWPQRGGYPPCPNAPATTTRASSASR